MEQNTVYLEINDFVISVKIKFAMNITILWYLKEYKKTYLPPMYFRRPNALKNFELFACNKLAVWNMLY